MFDYLEYYSSTNRLKEPAVTNRTTPQESLFLSSDAEKQCLDAYRVVSVRIRSAEFDEFCFQVRQLGLTNSMALRIAVRRIAGFLEVDSGTRVLLQDWLAQIGTISIEMRKLRGDGQGGHPTDFDHMEAICTELGTTFAQVDGILRSILNVSRRRSGGLSLLRSMTCK